MMRRERYGRAAACLLVLFLALGTAACEIDTLLVERPDAPAGLALSVAPAGAPATALLAAELADRVTVRVRRGMVTVLDTTLLFPAGSGSLAVRLPVPISGRQETLDISVELRRGPRSLLRGSRGALLRLGQVTDVEVPLSPAEEPPLAPLLSVSAGVFHSCGIAADGMAWCWGSNESWQLGGSPAGASTVPALVRQGFALRSISAGYVNSCGLDATGAAFCWGSNQYGGLGSNADGDSRIPVRVAGSLSFTSLSTAGPHACGVVSDASIRCWGYNGKGQLGDGTTTDRGAPGALAGPARRYTTVSVGALHTCALNEQGQAFCWGANDQGQLGTGDLADRAVPAAVVGGHRFTGISSGGLHSCAVTDAGEAFCWGYNGRGQLGVGTTTQLPAPTRVQAAAAFVAIDAGGLHTCARTPPGAAYCWGYNGGGILGVGSAGDGLTPVPVSGGLVVTHIEAGLHHSCALAADRRAYCWGVNRHGQLGNGFALDGSEPSLVVAPFAGADPSGPRQPEADPVRELLRHLGVR
jgi:alpha-tubulin suppressor-like RCC1 family protein